MRRLIPVLCACTLWISASGSLSESRMAGEIDLVQAEGYFREFDQMCRKDGGKLWGVSFCGPILLVDPGTRAAVGNQRDGAGRLPPRAGVFAGVLPADMGIANTAVEWSGKRWTMILWSSLDEDPLDRRRLMAHEAFHRIQPELQLTPTGEMNAHLDTAEGRFWLQEEWNALQKALLATGDARREAIGDAMAFRAARRAAFPGSEGREVPLEIFEGLAEYSGMRLAGFSGEQVVEAAMDQRKRATGFVRSFAYVSGPLYGFLLDGTGGDWRKGTKADTDLGKLLAGRLQLSPVPPQEAARRADVYGGAALRASETQREEKREARLAEWRASLIDGAVLVLDLSVVTSGSFDPREVYPFGEKQTVYGTRELIGEWGTLIVKGGAVLEDRNSGKAHVSLQGATDGFFEGRGWSLKLNEGWEVAPGERAGDQVVRRKSPH